MQQLTAAPRDTLTSAQVTRLLTGAPSLTVQAGLELLDTDLTVVADLSDNLESGSISRVMGARVHGTCRLRLDTELMWGTALVRPYQVLIAEGVRARFDLGVYALTTPARVVGADPASWDVDGYDRLYLMDRAVGDTYAVVSGSGYLNAVRSVVAAAGLTGLQLDQAAAFATLPTARVWPLVGDGSSATTWLDIANDLLAAVGYRGLYADPASGLLRSEPYVNPIARPVEFTLAASGPAAIVGDERTDETDLWATPNRWTFVQQNRAPGAAAPTEGDGVYTVENATDGPTSIDARGLVWPRVVLLDAADQPSLAAQGDVIVAADRRTARTIRLKTSPFPAAGHADVLVLDDPQLGDPLKVQALAWEQDLAGADTTWSLEGV